MADLAELQSVQGVFDRDAATRLDESLLNAAWAEDRAVVLRIQAGPKIPLSETGDLSKLDLLPVKGSRVADHMYVGRLNGCPVFATRYAEDDGYEEPTGGWGHPFFVGDTLEPVELELVIVALAIANWNASSQFSNRDGSPTESLHGGWMRVDEHGGEHFPRTDPAVIVLVEHDNKLLLGSNAMWESGRFSLLAGFVEAGESAEQAVAREVFEESGVRVEEIQYLASQPWPFPRSLMLGYRAKLAIGENPLNLQPDPTEISELRWFTRDELRNPAPDLLLPGSISIARQMLDLWVSEGDSE